MKKILVVGGAGYIGAHIAWLLQEGGYQVRIYDDFSNGLKSRVEGKFKDVVDHLTREFDLSNSFTSSNLLGITTGSILTEVLLERFDDFD